MPQRLSSKLLGCPRSRSAHGNTGTAIGMRMAADKVSHEQIYKTATFGLGRDTAEGDAKDLPVVVEDDRT